MADVAKFAHVPGLKAVYHHGPVTIYDTSGLGVAPKWTGFTGYHTDGPRALGRNFGRSRRPSHPTNQKAIDMGEIDRPGPRCSRDRVGCHSYHYFHWRRTLRPSPDARPRFHPGGRRDISRDPCGSAPKGRPAACPAPAFPAQTGSACPSSLWSRGRRGRARDSASMPRGSPMLPTSMRSSGPSPSNPTRNVDTSSQHRERENVSAGCGKAVGVRCVPSPSTTTRREIR